MSSKKERNKRKQELLLVIEQQRLDLSAARLDWTQATSRYDQGWQTLVSLRHYFAIATGIATIWSIRHPRFLLRWAKRAAGVWGSWRVIRKYLK